MKILCLFFTFAFAFFAKWQLNDTDQYGTQWWQGWFLTYSLTALVSFVSFFRPFSRGFYFAGAFLAFLHFLLRALAVQPEKTILYNAENPAGNEAGGLLIVCTWLLCLAFFRAKAPGRKER